MSVLVLDFGSQVTQLIARRVREAGVYCEIVPFNKADEALAKKPRAIILSGGPRSVYEEGAPRAPQAVFEAGVPVLGICYGEMTMSAQLGGKVEGGHNQEFGRADIHVQTKSPLLEGLAGRGRERTRSAGVGAKVEGAQNRKLGRLDIHVQTRSPLVEGRGESGGEPVWM